MSTHPTEPTEPTGPPDHFARLQAWGRTRRGRAILLGSLVLEGAFLPVPPEFVLTALALSDRQRIARDIVLCTLASTLGAGLGYLVGRELLDLANPLLAFVSGPDAWYGVSHPDAAVVHLAGADFYRYAVSSPHAADTSMFLRIRDAADANALATVALSGLAIPFKLATVASGLCDASPWNVLAGAAIGRGMRYVVIGALLRTYGDRTIALLRHPRHRLLLAGVMVCGLGALAVARFLAG